MGLINITLRTTSDEPDEPVIPDDPVPDEPVPDEPVIPDGSDEPVDPIGPAGPTGPDEPVVPDGPSGDDSQNNHVLKEKELCYVAYLWFSALGLSYKLKTSEKHFIKNRFEQTSVVCKYSNSTKTKLCYYVYKILGFQLTEWILGLYIKMKGRFQFGKQKLNAWK